MRRRTAALLLGGASLLAGTVLWSMRSAPSAGDPAARPAAAIPRVSVGLGEASLVLRRRGVPQAEIHARRVTVSRDLRTARFVGITRAMVYDQAGEALGVSAGEIVLDRESSNLEIRGPVLITSARGHRLTAPLARWDHARQQVVFPRGVLVRQGGQQLQARHLVVDASLTRFELSGGVDIVFQLEGGRP